MKRATVIVLDSFGVGQMPDSASFDDKNPDTAGHIYEACGELLLPNMYAMGLSHIDGVNLPKYTGKVCGKYAKLAEKSHGKDTVTGHWELMGIVSEHGFSIYEHGFPEYFMSKLESAWGVGTLCNEPASGTEVINRLGKEHVNTGKPIVYTSADSVLQVAAHEDVIPLSDLYDMCEKARELLDMHNMNVARVIARPFTGDETQGFMRTENRRDYSVVPPQDSVLDILSERGVRTLGIGKIEDIFAHRGLSLADHTKNNEDGINAVIAHLKACDSDFIFANLVDFDMLYGHRRDALGYKKALEYFDSTLPDIISLMTDGDMLIITADHGCDPTAPGTDHTREYVPMLMRCGRDCERAENLGIIEGFDFVGKSVLEWLS